MLRNLILSVALLAGCQTPEATFPKDPPDELGTAALRAHIPNDARVVWDDCGAINAYYTVNNMVVMCNELKPLPLGFQRGVLAHEFGHAFIHQNHIPFTGPEESAADELAAVALVEVGDREALLTVAQWYYALPPDGGDGDAAHPSNYTRAIIALCLYLQSGGDNLPGCPTDWVRVKNTWDRLRAR